jgi:hypothetical protein
LQDSVLLTLLLRIGRRWQFWTTFLFSAVQFTFGYNLMHVKFDGAVKYVLEAFIQLSLYLASSNSLFLFAGFGFIQ